MDLPTHKPISATSVEGGGAKRSPTACGGAEGVPPAKAARAATGQSTATTEARTPAPSTGSSARQRAGLDGVTSESEKKKTKKKKKGKGTKKKKRYSPAVIRVWSSGVPLCCMWVRR